MQRARASKVYFQKENPQGFDTLLTFVRERLPTVQEQQQTLEKSKSKKQKPPQQKHTSEKNVSYQVR